MFPVVAAFTDINFGFVERCSLTQMTVLYNAIVNKMLFDPREDAWVHDELGRLQSKNLKFNCIVDKKVVLHCSSRLFTLKLHFADHFVDDLERFRNLSTMNAGPFERFTVLERIVLDDVSAAFDEDA